MIFLCRTQTNLANLTNWKELCPREKTKASQNTLPLVLPNFILCRGLALQSLEYNILLQCNWKVQNHTQGPHKGIYTIYPPEKNYLCIITLLNAWGLVIGTSVLSDEKDWGILPFIYAQWELFPVWSLGFLLRPYAATGRKSNVSLADLIYNIALSLRVTLACFAFW